MADIKVLFSQVTDLIFKEVTNKLEEHSDEISGKLDSMYNHVKELETKISAILSDVSELKEEFSNYQRVSIVSNLNNQLKNKDVELSFLRKQLEKDKKSTEEVVQEQPQLVEEEVVETTESDNVCETTARDYIENDTTENEVTQGVSVEISPCESEEVVEEEEEVIEEEEEVVEEEEEVVQEEEEVVEDEEEGVSLIEKMLKDPKTGKRRKFLITEDTDRDIYDMDENGDPGDEPVGKLTGKNNKPVWF